MPNKNKTDEYICEIQNENISVKYKIVRNRNKLKNEINNRNARNIDQSGWVGGQNADATERE